MSDISTEQLSAYLDDALPPVERAAVERALAESPVLRRELDALKQTQAWVRGIPPAPVPTGFEQRVLRALQKPRPRTNWWVIAPSAFGAVATAVLMVLVIRQENPRKTRAFPVAPARPQPMAVLLEKEARDAAGPVPRGKAGRATEPLRDESSRLENRAAALRADAGAKEIAPGAFNDNKTAAVAQSRGEMKTPAAPEGVVLDATGVTAGSRRAVGFGAVGGSISDKDIGRERAAASATTLKKSARPPVDMRGDDSGVTDFREVTVRSEAAWRRLWAEHTAHRVPAPPAPDVDFTESMIIGVFLGTRPSGGHAVDILSVTPAGTGAVVTYREIRPAAGTAQITVLTQPYHLRVVPRRDGVVRFIKK